MAGKIRVGHVAKDDKTTALAGWRTSEAQNDRERERETDSEAGWVEEGERG